MMRIAVELNNVQLTDYNIGSNVKLLYQDQVVLTDVKRRRAL